MPVGVLSKCPVGSQQPANGKRLLATRTTQRQTVRPWHRHQAGGVLPGSHAQGPGQRCGLGRQAGSTARPGAPRSWRPEWRQGRLAAGCLPRSGLPAGSHEQGHLGGERAVTQARGSRGRRRPAPRSVPRPVFPGSSPTRLALVGPQPLRAEEETQTHKRTETPSVPRCGTQG